MNSLALAAKRRRIFYGWRIVGLAFQGLFAQNMVGTTSLGILLKPMGEELGWSRGALSGALSLQQFMSPFIGLVLGPLVDRKNGARLLMVVGALASGAAIMAVSQVQSLAQFYVIYGLVAALAIGGVSGVVVEGTVAKWFVRYRGRALAFTTLGIAASRILIPLVTPLLILAVGWRNTWVVFGLVFWATLVLPGALWMHRQPEDLGLKPDGASEVPAELAKRRPGREEVSFTFRETMRTPTFWLLILALNLGGLSMLSLGLHWYPYFTDVGIAPALAALGISSYGVFSIGGRFIWGFLAERLPMRTVLMANAATSALSMVPLLLIGSPATLFLYTFFAGLTLGGQPALLALTWSNYFGRLHIGAIQGVAQPLSRLAFSLGPWVTGLLFDITGGYRTAWLILLGAWIASFFLFIPARQARPARPA